MLSENRSQNTFNTLRNKSDMGQKHQYYIGLDPFS